MSSHTHVRRMIPLFVLGHFTHHVMTSITIPLLPFIRNSFDLDYTQAGLVVSAFLLSYGLGHLPAGWLADRVEARLLMSIGISGVALAGIMIGASDTFTATIVSLILMGILAGGYHPSAPTLIGAATPPGHLGKALGLHNIGGGASHLVTPLVAVTIAAAWGWQTAFISLAIPTLLFGLLFYSLLGRITRLQNEQPPTEPRANKHPLSRKERLFRLTVFLVLTTITGGIINAVISFAPLLFVDQFGMSKKLAAVYLSIIFAAAFWAGPLGGHLADRLGSMRVFLGVSLTGGPIIFLVSIVSGGWGAPFVLLLLGTVIFARMATAEAYIVQMAPTDTRSTILGIYYFTGMEGGGLMTPVLGYAIDQMGFVTAYGLAGIIACATVLVCSIWLWERDAEQSPTAPR